MGQTTCRMCGETHETLGDGRMSIHRTTTGERCNPDVKQPRQAHTEPEPLTDQKYGVSQMLEGGAPGLRSQHK